MADLYIRWRTSPKDTGLDGVDRPMNPCWPPNAFWTNASIYMTYPPNHPDPAKRGGLAYEARVDEEVLINVDCYSSGAFFPIPFPPIGDQAPVICQIWACTGANGVGPISALPSSLYANGSPREGVPIAVLAPPDDYGTASVPWTPQATDNLDFNAEGAAHICLAANLFYRAPGDGGGAGGPSSQGGPLPLYNPAAQPVQIIFPCGDGPVDPLSHVPIGRFHGQKNIQVLRAAAGLVLVVVIWIFGWGAGAQVRVLELTERTGWTELPPVIREHLLALPFVDLAGGRERRQRTQKITPELFEFLVPKFGEELLRAGPLPLEPRERARLAGGGQLVLAEKDVPLQPAERPLDEIPIEGAGKQEGNAFEVTVGPKDRERVAIDLGAAEKDRPGTVRIMDLVERDGEGGIIGGTTFVTVAG
jgi:hypothetical protein